MQHKGDSECTRSPRRGATDELCGFEKLPYDRFSATAHVRPERSLARRVDFVRDALEARPRCSSSALGRQPVQARASSAAPTRTSARPARSTRTQLPRARRRRRSRPARTGCCRRRHARRVSNPGRARRRVGRGELARRALRGACSGARPTARAARASSCASSAAAKLPADICAEPDFVERGYAGGVPMGGDLRRGRRQRAARASPRARVQDPGTPTTPGAPLQRVQISRAGSTPAARRTRRSSTSPATRRTAPRRPRDLHADRRRAPIRSAASGGIPTSIPQRALYYARVLENPSCRWSTYAVQRAGRRLRSGTPPTGYEACCGRAVGGIGAARRAPP